MPNKELAPLTDREEEFINALFECDGNIRAVAESTGIHPRYCYTLRKRLSMHIAEAAQQYLAMHSVKAAHTVVDHMDKDMPNVVHLQAAKEVLDRAGVIRKDFTEKEEEKPVIKANIFILPEKKFIEIIEHNEFTG